MQTAFNRNQDTAKVPFKSTFDARSKGRATASDRIQARLAFNIRKSDGKATSSLFGIWRDTPKGAVYTVYSYGYHFPIAAFLPEVGWIGNSDKYSATTSQHQSVVRRAVIFSQVMPTDMMKEAIQNGELL